MTSRRSLLVRITLAVVGVLLFCVFVYGALGWAVWSCQPRLVNLLGKRRFNRWWLAYANATAALFPGDADGDGVCDGLEYFFQSDAHNPALHPRLGVSNRPGSLAVPESRGDYFVEADDRLFVRNGTRQHLQCWMLIAGEPHPFPSGFQIRLNPSPLIALALPGGTPATGALLVPVARDGAISFDVLMRPEHLAHPRLEETIAFTDASSTTRYASMRIKCIWEQGIIDPHVDTAPRMRLPASGNRATFIKETPDKVRLSWPTVVDSAEAVVVEAARDDAHEEWFPIIIYSATQESAAIVQRAEGLIPGHTEPVKFRVVPVSFSPPAVGAKYSDTGLTP